MYNATHINRDGGILTTDDNWSTIETSGLVKGGLLEELIDKIADRVIERQLHNRAKISIEDGIEVDFNKSKWKNSENRERMIDDFINETITATKDSWNTVELAIHK